MDLDPVIPIGIFYEPTLGYTSSAYYYFNRPGVIKSWCVTHTNPGYGTAQLPNTYYLYLNQTGQGAGDTSKATATLRTRYTTFSSPNNGYTTGKLTISPTISIAAGDYVMIRYTTTGGTLSSLNVNIQLHFEAT